MRLKNVKERKMRTLYDEIKEKANEKRNQGKILEAESIEAELRENKSVAKDVIIEHDGVEQISLIDPKSIKFVWFSEGGACGDPGKIYIVTKKSNGVHKYCFDYMNETPIEAFDALLPWLKPFVDSISYILNTKKHPSGFKHIYMGLGNSLFVAEDISDEFVDEKMAFLIKTRQRSKIYQQWKDRASFVLGKEI